MDWQTPFVWIAIGLAAVFVGWRAYRLVRPIKAGCGGGCGCAKGAVEKPSVLITPEQLILRSKTGQPQ
ncbi:MAG: hypothetical protein HYX68_12475 [Planctomycetes bacterium]|jgi:hypothetical protein|nr:hypothetical protein [Planctomycetota bacterium]